MNFSPRQRQIIERYRSLLSFTVRAFYNDIEIVVMDAFLYLYFKTFMVTTAELQRHTSFPEAKLREILYLFKKDKLIRDL